MWYYLLNLECTIFMCLLTIRSRNVKGSEAQQVLVHLSFIVLKRTVWVDCLILPTVEVTGRITAGQKHTVASFSHKQGCGVSTRVITVWEYVQRQTPPPPFLNNALFIFSFALFIELLITHNTIIFNHTCRLH